MFEKKYFTNNGHEISLNVILTALLMEMYKRKLILVLKMKYKNTYIHNISRSIIILCEK